MRYRIVLAVSCAAALLGLTAGLGSGQAIVASAGTAGTVAWGNYTVTNAPPAPPASPMATGTLNVLGTYTVNPGYSLKEAQLKYKASGGSWVTYPTNPALYNGQIGKTVQNPPGTGPITVDPFPADLHRGAHDAYLRVEYYYIPNPANPPPNPTVVADWSASINFTI